jgi:hypothetical protein
LRDAAPQQRDGERRLECTDLLAHRLLGHVQLVGCAREVAVFGDGHEVAHLPQVCGHDPRGILRRAALHPQPIRVDRQQQTLVDFGGRD